MSYSSLLSLGLCLGLLGASFTDAMPDRDPYSTLFLVNTQYKVSEQYVPITHPSNVRGESKNLQWDAAWQLEQLFIAAKQNELSLYSKSAYRSFASQTLIFKRKLAANQGDEVEANQYVAFPGSSEHQLGLAVDVTGPKDSLTPKFGETTRGLWLADNAHKFGFIIRYPLGKEEITGIQYEPWHLRYVGIEPAKDIQFNNLSLEEYSSQKRLQYYKHLLEIIKD